MSYDDNEAIEGLTIYSPVIPRKGELLNIKVDDTHHNLEVLGVLYEFEKAGIKPRFGSYQCLEISIEVKAQ